VSEVQSLARRLLLPAAGLFLFSLCFSRTVALRYIALGATLLIVLGQRDRVYWRGLPIWPTLALWAAVALATLPFARDIRFSLHEIRAEIGYGVVTVWLFYVVGRDPRAWGSLRPAILAGVLTASVLAITWFALFPVDYHFGLHGGQGVFSTLLVCVYPLLLAWALEDDPARPPMLVAAIGTILVAAAYTTLNRALWFSVALETLVLTAAWTGSRRAGARNGVWKPMSALAVAAAVLAGTVLMQRAANHRGGSTTVAEAIGEDPRWEIWHYAIGQIAERPWTGAGYGRAVLADPMRERFAVEEAWHAHNWFLDWGVQMGIPGIVALVLLLGSIAWALRRLQREDDPRARPLAAVGLAILVGTLAKNTTDDFFVDQSALLFWALIGLILGTLRGPPRRHAP
jgi:O-antigen ligase